MQVTRKASAFCSDGVLGGFLAQTFIGEVQLLSAFGDALFEQSAVIGFLCRESFSHTLFLGDIFDQADNVERLPSVSCTEEKFTRPQKRSPLLRV